MKNIDGKEGYIDINGEFTENPKKAFLGCDIENHMTKEEFRISVLNDMDKEMNVITYQEENKSIVNTLEEYDESKRISLSKAIVDAMGNFYMYFVQPDGGIGNKVVKLCFESILYVGSNGFVMFGNGKISGKRLYRGKLVDDIEKVKIFYDACTKAYSWINTYKVNNDRYIRPIRKSNLILPKGDANEMLENKINESRLLDLLASFIHKTEQSHPRQTC